MIKLSNNLQFWTKVAKIRKNWKKFEKIGKNWKKLEEKWDKVVMKIGRSP